MVRIDTKPFRTQIRNNEIFHNKSDTIMMTDINLFVLLPKENKTFGKRTIAKMSKYAVILPNTP